MQMQNVWIWSTRTFANALRDFQVQTVGKLAAFLHIAYPSPVRMVGRARKEQMATYVPVLQVSQRINWF